MMEETTRTDDGSAGSTMAGPDNTVAPTQRSAARYLLPAAVLIGAVLLGMALLRTAPRASRKSPTRSAKLVQVEVLRLGDHATTIEAMGTVLPAQEITLTSRVNGEVVALSPEFGPGGSFQAGEELVRIDPSDYELFVRQRSSSLAQAESAHQLEMGQQAVARREYQLLGETVAPEDRDLVLRRPQLQSAEAAVNSARAALEDARLDLQRTCVIAPFNAVLREKRVDLGAQVSGASPLCTLVGTDEFWVEAAVPVDQLRWLSIPRAQGQPGAAARVYSASAWGREEFRVGKVIRMRPGLEEQGRMARLLISIQDPLSLQPEHASWPRLILSMYVRIEMEGVTLRNVATISRSALQDGDFVHLMDEDDKLEIRPLEVVFRTADAVLVRGVQAGERLITTNLSAPVEGMPLRLLKDATRTALGGGMEAGS